MFVFLINSIKLAAVNDAIGSIEVPPYAAKFGAGQEALLSFSNILLKVVFAIAGIYGFINLILAGFQFMNAGGDPKVIGKAWEKIWQSFLGLVVIVGSFLFAAIIGQLLFGDATAILSPKLQ